MKCFLWFRVIGLIGCIFGFGISSLFAEGVRARDLGIPFEGLPGPYNAITDVEGVEVGHSTIIRGEGKLVKGEGPVRTGVTAILPRGPQFSPVFAATYTLNGNGEMTGIHWIEESGFLETPIVITNTFSVGVARDSVISWMDETGNNADPQGGLWYTYPVVAETYDLLNDILGQHVTKEHVYEALNGAAGGSVAEGNVGGGTGMIAHDFKGGIGTASRMSIGGYTVGVLVQANHGGRDRFSVEGVPVGKEIRNLRPNFKDLGRGSIIVVVATDAPLLPQQLKRLAQRVPMGVGRLGALGGNGSGDIFIALSTSNQDVWEKWPTAEVEMLPNEAITTLFEATVQATEEAILNAMVAAETMTGRDNVTAHALPHDRLQEALKKYNRWVEPSSLPRAVHKTAEELVTWVGEYEDESRPIRVKLYLEDDKLYIEMRGNPYRAVPMANGRFYILRWGAMELEPEIVKNETSPRLKLMRGDKVLARFKLIDGE